VSTGSRRQRRTQRRRRGGASIYLHAILPYPPKTHLIVSLKIDKEVEAGLTKGVQCLGARLNPRDVQVILPKVLENIM
jgi:hypothetical protein